MQGPLDPRSGLPLAGLGERVIAYLIDFALFIGLLLVLGLFANVVSVVSQGLGDFVGVLGAVVFFGGSVTYFVVADGGAWGRLRGSTFGASGSSGLLRARWATGRRSSASLAGSLT